MERGYTMKAPNQYRESDLYGWTKVTCRTNGMIEFLAEEWCEKNIDDFRWSKPYGSANNVFMFRKAEDATLFALKWG